MIKEEQLPLFNKHHIIPRSYFKKKNIKILNDKNIVQLSIVNHLWVHYYAFKCANPIIKKERILNAKKSNKIRNINTGEIFDSIATAQRKYNIYGISRVIKNKTKSGGFYWEKL